ncbi:MAG: DUF1559 domain-containing protein [Gemmataceae bacterium]
MLTAVHEEVAGLPDKYRLPVLLCFFEGLSHADAAKRLGWPVGTVAGRVARAKDALHARLTRRGVTAPAAAVAALSASEAAGLGGAFAADTARAAAAFAGGAVVPGVSPAVLLLAKGAIRAMTVTKLQLAAGLVAALGAVTVGGAWAVGQGPGGAPSPGGGGAAPAAAQPTTPPSVTPLDQLGKQTDGKTVTIDLLVREVRRGKSQTRKADDGGPDDLILSGVQSLENDDRVQIVLTGAARPDWAKWDQPPESRGVKYLRRKVRATGKANSAMYMSFPAVAVYEVLVDDPKAVLIDPPPAPPLPGGRGAMSEGGLGGAPGGEAGAGAAEGAGAAAPPPPVERLKVDPNAPNPGKPSDPNRTADYAQRRQSLKNLKQITLAIHSFSDATGRMPTDIRAADGRPLLSWRVALLPYLEQAPLYNRFKLDEPWDSDHNRKLAAELPNVYRLGFQPKGATDTYYQAFTGPSTAFEPGKPLRFPASFPDGVSNVIGVAEIGPPVPWTKPEDVPYHPGRPFPKAEWPFANVIHFGTMDGAAHKVKPDIGEWPLRLLIDRDDGQPVPDLEKMRPSLPAESDEEQAELKRLAAENQGLLVVIEEAMQKQVKLWALMNGSSTEVAKLEELNRMLKWYTAEIFGPLSKRYRDELGLRPGAAIPDPPKKK